jgi:hypothetical protein
MEKEIFEKIVKENLIPSILQQRAKLPPSASPRALVILDGHSTRNNYELARLLASLDIDVLVIPSHSSHVLQPLDRCVNGQFKIAIKRKKITFPSKKNEQTSFLPFVETLEDCMEEALLRPNVRKGFELACIALRPCEALLPDLDPKPTSFEIPEKTRFGISGELLTSPEFLKRWEDHLEKKTNERKEEKLEMKRKSKKPSGTSSALGEGHVIETARDDEDLDEIDDSTIDIEIEKDAGDVHILTTDEMEEVRERILEEEQKEEEETSERKHIRRVAKGRALQKICEVSKEEFKLIDDIPLAKVKRGRNLKKLERKRVRTLSEDDDLIIMPPISCPPEEKGK